MNSDEIEERSFNRRFKFGKKVYLSTKELMMPIFIKTGDKDYIKMIVVASVIAREEDLFLCGLKTLQGWRVEVFYERNELEFTEIEKRVLMEMSKGGH